MFTQMPRSSRILGIDPGFGRTGIGIVDVYGSDATHVMHTVIETPKEDDFSQRLLALRDELRRIIETQKPDAAAVEQLFFSTNVKTAMKVGMARGVVLLTLAECNVPLVELTPNQVKQGIAGWGGADKKQVQGMVARLLKLKEIPKPDDAADALALAIVGGFIARFPHA
jgi:crossover junction endodeoxyribonuclease RuvC